MTLLTQRAYDEAIKISPRNLHVLNAKKDLLKSLKRNEEVVIVCNEILVLAPKDRDALVDKGSASLFLKKPNEALVCFNKALDHHADDPRLVRAPTPRTPPTSRKL